MTATTATATATRKPAPFCSGTGQEPSVAAPDGSGVCAVCGGVAPALTKRGRLPRHQAVNVEPTVEATPAPAAPKAEKPAPKAEEATEDEAPKGPAYRAPVVREGSGLEAKFHKVRANGTTRAIPTYPVGTAARETAEAMDAARTGGATVAAVAAAFHVSVPTVRRMLQSLALTQQQEKAAAAAAKAAATRAAKSSK